MADLNLPHESSNLETKIEAVLEVLADPGNTAPANAVLRSFRAFRDRSLPQSNSSEAQALARYVLGSICGMGDL